MERNELALGLMTDRHFEGLGYTRHMVPTRSGGIERLVIVAEGETARELLPLVENFEALMEPEEATS